MPYDLKITENNKTTQYKIQDLKELKRILEQYKEKLIEVELHKIKEKGLHN